MKKTKEFSRFRIIIRSQEENIKRLKEAIENGEDEEAEKIVVELHKAIEKEFPSNSSVDARIKSIYWREIRREILGREPESYQQLLVRAKEAIKSYGETKDPNIIKELNDRLWKEYCFIATDDASKQILMFWNEFFKEVGQWLIR